MPVVYISDGRSKIPQIKFTDRKITSLKTPTKGQIDYFDKDLSGFALRVSYGGTRTWFLKYVSGGVQCRMTIGKYPIIGLADARKNALALKHDIASGINPALALKLDRKALTFLGLAEIYIERHAKVKKRSWRGDQRILMKYCAPWHRRKAADVTRADVVELLHDISGGGAGIMANRVLACVRKLYNYGMKNGLAEANPAHMVDAPAQEVSRDRVYSEDEIASLWEAFGLPGTGGGVFKMCLATGQRLGEVAGMRWDEIDGNIWTLPGDRTKNRRTHVVPLNGVARDILEQLRGRNDEFVFPSLFRPGRHVAAFQTTVRRVRELSGVADFRTHDLRRTFATEITKLKFTQFIVGRLLNHVQNSVTARYDRNEYLDEKVEASEAWGRRLRGIVDDEAKVVQLVPAG